MVRRTTRSPEVLRVRSSEGRRSRSTESHSAAPSKSSKSKKKKSRPRSASKVVENRRIYQPPVLQSGYQGRDGRAADEYRPFSPGTLSQSSMTGTWDRTGSRTPVSVRDDNNSRRYPSGEYYSSGVENDDRTVSYYRSTTDAEDDLKYSSQHSRQHQLSDEMNHGSQHSQKQQFVQQLAYEYQRSRSGTIQSRNTIQARGRSAEPVFMMQPNSASDYYYDADGHHEAEPPQSPLTPRRQRKLSRWYQSRFPVLSKSESTMASAADTAFTDYTSAHDESRGGTVTLYTEVTDEIKTRQELSYFAFGITAVQLLILMIQLFLCGVAPFDVNPMIGPFPGTFSEWGGKNAYLMLIENQWWRIITPTFLHVGILHFIANVYCQLGVVAQFEREWGSFKWILIYLLSALGCSVFSNFFDVDSIAVTSSGALMGMYAAKLAEVTIVSFFDSTRDDIDDVIRLDQLSSVLCGLILMSILGSFTFIDWSGNMGGLLVGYLSGLVLFGDSIKGCCTRFFWVTLCLCGLFASFGFVSYEFYETANPDDQLGDVCEYFRHLYPENADCECLVF